MVVYTNLDTTPNLASQKDGRGEKFPELISAEADSGHMRLTSGRLMLITSVWKLWIFQFADP